MTGGGRKRSVFAALFTLVFAAGFWVVPGDAAHAEGGVPDPTYGTWFDGLSPTPAAAQAELDRLAAAGVGLVRQYVWWDRIETTPPNPPLPTTYDWSRTDQLVTDATARGITILPTLLYTPTFYSSKPPGSTSTAQFPPSDPQTMARFAEAMVKRYGPLGSYWCTFPLPQFCQTPYVPLKMWEVWNEPDYPSWWKGKPNASEYAPLLSAVYDAIKGADPSAEVLLGSLTGKGGSAEGGFLDQLYALGVGNKFDTITINPYAKDVPGMVAFLRGARAIAERYGDGQKPIRVTEYGWATNGRSPLTVVDEPCQAALLHAATRRLAALRTELNIKSVIQFQWHDVLTTSTAWPHYAGVVRADGTAKPSLGAFTEAIANRPAPPGFTLAEACPEDRRNLDPMVRGNIADDTFTRTSASAWGSAETGGTYTHGEGTDPSFSVAGGVGRIEVPTAGSTRSALLGSASARDVDVQIAVSTDKPANATNGQSFTLFFRRTASDTEYRVRTGFSADGRVRLRLLKVVGGTETPLSGEFVVPGLTHVPGAFIRLRARASGVSPTTLEVKAWATGYAEPSAWSLTRTDSETALQAKGTLGLRADLSGSTTNAPVVFAVDDLHATGSSPK